MKHIQISRLILAIICLVALLSGIAFAGYCPDCGAKCDEGAKFCSKCGAALTGSGSQQQQKQQVTIVINNNGEFFAPHQKEVPQPLYQSTITLTGNSLDNLKGELDGLKWGVVCSSNTDYDSFRIDVNRTKPGEYEKPNDYVVKYENFSITMNESEQAYSENVGELRIFQAHGYKFVIYLSKVSHRERWERTASYEFRIYPDYVMIETQN